MPTGNISLPVPDLAEFLPTPDPLDVPAAEDLLLYGPPLPVLDRAQEKRPKKNLLVKPGTFEEETTAERLRSPQIALEQFLEDVSEAKRFTSRGFKWIQRLSTEGATADDYDDLLEAFYAVLQKHKALPFGQCPIRRRLYRQCLDEVIRRLAVEDSKMTKAKLLLAYRDEMDHLLMAYKKMAMENGGYVYRKEITSCKRVDQKKVQLQEVQKEKEAMQLKVKAAQDEVKAEEEKLEKIQVAEKKLKEELTFAHGELKKMETEYNRQWKQITDYKKSLEKKAT